MTDHNSTDSRLVAYLHGELEPTERRAVRELLSRDPDAQARLEMLEATDKALSEALDRDDAPRPATRVRSFVQPLLALAALLAVVAIFVFNQENNHSTAGKNEHLDLRAAPRGGATAPLFTDAAFELFWTNLDSSDPKRVIRVVPFSFGQTTQQVAAEVDKATMIASHRMGVLPVVITARIHGPDDIVLDARFAPRSGKPFDIDGERKTQVVPLRDFEVSLPGMRPTMIGNPGEREWLDDARWSLTEMPMSEAARWFPETPGEWRLELSVMTLPAPEAHPWPTFPEPLEIRTTILMTGEVSAWGEADDGMRARIVWSLGAKNVDRTPFAVQIKNESKEPRKYNYAGTTIAKIPQPMHFTLIVDGEEWTQNDRAPLLLASGDLMRPHPVGAVRSIVTRAGFWHREGKRLSTMPGRHSVEVLFHFQPSIWNVADTSIWHGKLPTGRIEIEVGKAR